MSYGALEHGSGMLLYTAPLSVMWGSGVVDWWIKLTDWPQAVPELRTFILKHLIMKFIWKNCMKAYSMWTSTSSADLLKEWDKDHHLALGCHSGPWEDKSHHGCLFFFTICLQECYTTNRSLDNSTNISLSQLSLLSAIYHVPHVIQGTHTNTGQSITNSHNENIPIEK